MGEKNPIRMLVVLYGTAFIAAYSENIINVALIDIESQFAVSDITAQWLVTGYMIVATCVVAIMSFLSRRFSLRTLFFSATGIFLVTSVAAMLAPTFPLLLTFRLIQAIGTGIFIPTMMNTVMIVTPKQKLGTMLAIGNSCISLGPAFGPVLSGVFVTCFGWRSIFVPACAAALILLIAGFFLLRNIGELEAPKLDAPSLALAVCGLTLVVFGLTQLTTNTLVAVISLLIGLALMFVFGRRQLAIPNPMVDIRPLLRPRFAIACVLSVIAMMTTFSMSVLMPLYFQGSLLYTALISGLLVLIPIAFNTVSAIVGGRMMDAHGPWPLLPVGFALIVIGQFVVFALSPSMNVVPVIIAAAVVYAGVGLVFSPSQTSGLQTLNHAEAPHGLAIINTFTQMAGALGPSLFVGLLAGGKAASLAAGASDTVAQAAGFSHAVLIAAIIALIGMVLSFFFSRSAAKLGYIQHDPEEDPQQCQKNNNA